MYYHRLYLVSATATRAELEQHQETDMSVRVDVFASYIYIYTMVYTYIYTMVYTQWPTPLEGRHHHPNVRQPIMYLKHTVWMHESYYTQYMYIRFRHVHYQCIPFLFTVSAIGKCLFPKILPGSRPPPFSPQPRQSPRRRVPRSKQLGLLLPLPVSPLRPRPCGHHGSRAD